MRLMSWLSNIIGRRGERRLLDVFGDGKGFFQIFGSRRSIAGQHDVGTWSLYLPEQSRKSLLYLIGGLPPGVSVLVGPEAGELSFFDLPRHVRDNLQGLAFAARTGADEGFEHVPSETDVGPCCDSGRRVGLDHKALLLVNLDVPDSTDAPRVKPAPQQREAAE